MARIDIDISADEKAEWQAAAKRERNSLSQMIREAVRKHIKEME